MSRWSQWCGRCSALAVVFCVSAPLARSGQLEEALKKPILREGEARTQLDFFVLARVPQLEMAETAEAWQAAAERMRQRVLDEVIFRGVPETWRRARPAVVWGDTVLTGKGYVLRKLRYEALPGLWIPAVLYEPENLQATEPGGRNEQEKAPGVLNSQEKPQEKMPAVLNGRDHPQEKMPAVLNGRDHPQEKMPAVLNVNGHAATGKATPYKQIRCINQAKRGMLAMNLEWIGMGQLRDAGYSHNHLALLDLCGRSGVSVFYLAMARGLDVLLDHPHADLNRTAVTGLSGGGWQTIILSSLDTRVRLAVPVAGHSSIRQRVPHRSSIGDLEQNPVDLVSIADYVHLNALLAPRPALMIYNAKDDCCFVADTVKSNTYDPVVPVYEQAGVPDALQYYINHDPGTHNYDLDNRQQSYAFIQKHFGNGQASSAAEIPSEDEVQTAEALHVPLPEGNANFFTLAAEIAQELPRQDPSVTPGKQRERLQSILRFQSLAASGECSGDAETVAGMTVQRYRIQAGEEWCVPAVVVRGEKADRTTLFMADGGFAASAGKIEELIGAGQQVLALDPVLIGQAKPGGGIAQDAMLLGTIGQRPLGIQAAQTLAALDWLETLLAVKEVDVCTIGPRSGLIALCAAAIHPARFHNVQCEGLPETLKDFLKPGASYDRTPEAYCFGLLEWFDRDGLERLAQK